MRPDLPSPGEVADEVRVVALDLQIVDRLGAARVDVGVDSLPAGCQQADFVAGLQRFRGRPAFAAYEERVLGRRADRVATDRQIVHQRLSLEPPQYAPQ